ncbi:MAG: zinc ribbon domain-containing protein [Chloroflexota bacterium]
MTRRANWRGWGREGKPLPAAPTCPACGKVIKPGVEECSFCGQLLCPSCGTAVADTDETCPHCGVEFDLFCPACDAKISATAAVCPACGLHFED